MFQQVNFPSTWRQTHDHPQRYVIGIETCWNKEAQDYAAQHEGVKPTSFVAAPRFRCDKRLKRLKAATLWSALTCQRFGLRRLGARD
jgi:hypothetical protein